MDIRGFAAAALLGLAASTASAQVITTALPDEGSTSNEKRWALHLSVSPLAKWDVNPVGESFVFGDDALVASANPTSDFLIAGEATIRAHGDIQVSGGLWYNKLGEAAYDFGYFVPTSPSGLVIGGTLGGDVKITGAHAGVFWKEFGVQAGIVHTTGSIYDFSPGTVALPGQVGTDIRNFVTTPQLRATFAQVLEDDFSSTDVSVFGVYRRALDRVSFSGGIGVYHFENGGVIIAPTGDGPVRGGETVLSGFASAHVPLWRGFGVDASYWLIGGTDYVQNTAASGALSRFTVGVGYAIAR